MEDGYGQTEVRLDGWRKGFLVGRGMTEEAARQCAKDRKECNATIRVKPWCICR